MSAEDDFRKNVKVQIADKDARARLEAHSAYNIVHSARSLNQFSNLELARNRAAYTKWKVLENLDKYLIDFEATVMRKGGKVLWAYDADNARNEIAQIIKRTNAQRIIKSRSSLADEIGLAEFIRSKSVELAETDMGDFVNDLSSSRSSHMVQPAMHREQDEINNLLNKRIGASMDVHRSELATDIREHLRERVFKADIGISGANFLIADSGMVAISENEGNARLVSSIPRVHIVLASIEKIIPSINDTELFFSLLASYGTGQKLTTYNTIVGPKTNDDQDGPQEFIVILLDNGRSALLTQADQRSALTCIKCGACSNVCPVFKYIGGTNYQSSIPGPIGMVSTPHEAGLSEFKHLSFASPACGKCNDACPMKIDLHNHLLRNRRDATHQGHVSTGDKLAWYTWKKMVLSRKNLNRAAGIKNFTFRQFFRSDWGEQREFPKIQDKSFNQLWREKFGGS